MGSFPSDREDNSPVSDMVVMSAKHELDSLDIRVAFGFWRKYRDVRRQFWEDLEVSQKSRPDIFESIDTVVFAGHSLGGTTFFGLFALGLIPCSASALAGHIAWRTTWK